MNAQGLPRSPYAATPDRRQSSNGLEGPSRQTTGTRQNTNSYSGSEEEFVPKIDTPEEQRRKRNKITLMNNLFTNPSV